MGSHSCLLGRGVVPRIRRVDEHLPLHARPFFSRFFSALRYGAPDLRGPVIALGSRIPPVRSAFCSATSKRCIPWWWHV